MIRRLHLLCLTSSRFSIKPWYDSGELRHLDTLTPPWPAFLIVGNADSISRITPAILSKFLATLTQQTAAFKSGGPATITHLTAAPFNYKSEDAEKWLSMTEWAAKPGEISRKVVDETIAVLKKAGVVKGDVEPKGWIAEGVGKLV